MRICWLCTALFLLLAAAGGCKRKEPPPIAQESTFKPVSDEVIRQNIPRDTRPELIPLDSVQRYVPAGAEPGRRSPGPVEAGGLSASEISSPPESPPSVTLDELLERATTRQSCNIVMGCKSERGLIAMGEVAVRPIIEKYRSMKWPSYQKFHLIEILGETGHSSSVPFMEGLLKDPHWNARSNAAIALGKLGSTNSLSELKRLLKVHAQGRDFGFLYGLAYAVEKLGGTGGKKVLLEALTPTSVAKTNWGYTRIALAAARDLNLREACKNLKVCIVHNDTFLKKEAIRAAATLACSSDDISYAVAAQLENRVPSVRREAAGTLKELTGMTFDSFDDWEQYFQKRESR